MGIQVRASAVSYDVAVPSDTVEQKFQSIRCDADGALVVSVNGGTTTVTFNMVAGEVVNIIGNRIMAATTGTMIWYQF